MQVVDLPCQATDQVLLEPDLGEANTFQDLTLGTTSKLELLVCMLRGTRNRQKRAI